MSLPYQTSFQGLKLAGLLADRCHPIKGDLVRIYFRLSEPPPLGWSYLFTNVWRGLGLPLKRQAGVDGDAIWIDCIPEEVTASLSNQLEQALRQTDAIYQKKAREQAGDAERQSQLQARLHFKLQELRETLYPEPAPRSWKNALRARWSRFISGARAEKPAPPVAPRALVAPAELLRDYEHGCFAGAAISADGQALELDYFDHDPDGVRFRYRYVLSPRAAPRLVSGFVHEESCLDYEIPFERLPQNVISEAKDWLTAQSEAQRLEPGPRLLTELWEYLNEPRKTAVG